MALYLLTYDLNKPDRDYSDLYAKLEELGAKRVQESVWMLRIKGTTAGKLRVELTALFHSKKDRLLVAKVRDWATWNPITSVSEI